MPSVTYATLCATGSRIAKYAALLGGLVSLVSSVSALSGKPYGIAGVLVGLSALGASIRCLNSPSPISMALVGAGLAAIAVWVIPDLFPTSSTDAGAGPMAVFGACVFVAYSLYAFWLAYKLKQSSPR